MSQITFTCGWANLPVSILSPDEQKSIEKVGYNVNNGILYTEGSEYVLLNDGELTARFSTQRIPEKKRDLIYNTIERTKNIYKSAARGSYYFHSSCKIESPIDLLTLEERLVLENLRDELKKENPFYLCSKSDLSGIFYKPANVEFFGIQIPKFVQFVLTYPHQNKIIKSEINGWKDDAMQLKEDIERFPLDTFLEKLHELRDTEIIYNQDLNHGRVLFRNVAYADFSDNGTRQIHLSDLYKWKSRDPMLATAILLHEKFHFVEAELSDYIRETLENHPRWKIKMFGVDKWQSKLCDISWEGKMHNGYNINTTHLAELLAGLIMVRHPQIIKEILPIYDYTLNLINDQTRK